MYTVTPVKGTDTAVSNGSLQGKNPGKNTKGLDPMLLCPADVSKPDPQPFSVSVTR